MVYIIIIKSFKHNNELQGTLYREVDISIDNDINLTVDYDSFEKLILADKSKTTFKSLKTIFPFIGSTLARETLHRSNLEDKVHVSELTSADCKNIYYSLKEVFNELNTPEPIIYFNENNPRVLSLIKLKHLSGANIESYKTVNDAVKDFVIKTYKVHNIDAYKKELLLKIKNELDKLCRTEEALRLEITETDRSKEYEHIAKVILANIQHLTKGTKDIEIEDVFENEKLVKISLDPKLTPAQNADKYFNKARKAKSAKKEIVSRLTQINKRISLLEKLLLHLDNCLTKEQLDEFQEEYENELKSMKLISEKEKVDLPPFRIFKVIGGFEVWVGKGAKSNDLLTMKYAKPNDIWFHVRGASGSHTLLRVPNMKSKPTKEALNQAASITAYYSKMRNASNVPVSYCEKKYVRKSKMGNVGEVKIEREKVIFVEPKLPPQIE